MAPAYSSSTGWTTNSIAVTTPKLPPPPRSAQNRFGWCSASARTRLPSAVTTSSAVTALVCMPNLRDSQPMPPPSEYPAIPTSGDEPCRAARPCADSRPTTRSHLAPAPTRTRRAPGSTLDLLQAADVQQQRVLEVAERALVVAGRLRGDAQPDLAGIRDRRDDALVVGRQRDRGRVLVEQEVEGGTGFIPAGVAGEQEGQRGERGEHAAMVRIARPRRRSPNRRVVGPRAPPRFRGWGRSATRRCGVSRIVRMARRRT